MKTAITNRQSSSENFEWYTEDDDRAWRGESPPARPPDPTSRRRLALLLLLLIVSGATAVVYRQLQERVASTTAAVEADVLRLHRLVYQAALRHDVELFNPLLSGRDTEWAEAQDELVRRGYWIDRAFWGLDAGHAATLSVTDYQESVVTAVTLSPDLQTAEVQYRQTYQLADASAVTLEHTAVYFHSDADRWLLIRPADDFWGEWQTRRGARLDVAFPERDRALALRLAADFDALVVQLCGRLADLNCPADLRLVVNLEADPQALLDSAQLSPPELATNADGRRYLSLPAPTLAGRPLDEAGYQALYRGYAASLAAAIITDLSDWTCCDQAPFFLALLHYQLSQLGLRPWPVDAAVYQRALAEPLQLDALNGYFQRQDADVLGGDQGWQIYLLMDYLLHALPDLTPFALQNRLVEQPFYLAWLPLRGHSSELPGANTVLEHVADRVRFHAYLQSLALPADTPAPPLPEQDLIVLCQGTALDPTPALYRFHSQSQSWRYDRPLAGHTLMARLPDYSALILSEYTLEQRAPIIRSHLLAAGRLSLLLESRLHLYSFGQIDPRGRQALYYSLPGDGLGRAALLDRLSPDCDDEGCPLRYLSGNPTWSPDGRQMLLQRPVAGIAPLPALVWLERQLLTLHDADSQVTILRAAADGQALPGDPRPREVGMGYATFWVDNETYGYARLAAATRPGLMVMATRGQLDQEVVLASVADDEPQRLLDLHDLAQAAPDGRAWRNQPYFIRYVLPHPVDPDQFVVTVFHATRLEAYLFSFDRRSNAATYLMTLAHRSGQLAGFSPDGRYLLLTGDSDEPLVSPNLATNIYLFDWQTKAVQQFHISRTTFTGLAYDWSADGRWLALNISPNHLLLIAPETGYRRLINHAGGECTVAAWLNW